jgi:hypothetical protein
MSGLPFVEVYMVSRYITMHSIAVKSEKWIYPTISEKILLFVTVKNISMTEMPVSAAIHEQQHSYKKDKGQRPPNSN